MNTRKANPGVSIEPIALFVRGAQSNFSHFSGGPCSIGVSRKGTLHIRYSNKETTRSACGATLVKGATTAKALCRKCRRVIFGYECAPDFSLPICLS